MFEYNRHIFITVHRKLCGNIHFTDSYKTERLLGPSAVITRNSYYLCLYNMDIHLCPATKEETLQVY